MAINTRTGSLWNPQNSLPTLRPSLIHLDSNIAAVMASLNSLCETSSTSPTSNSSVSTTYASPTDLIAATKAYVKDYMSRFDASHDYAHIERVLALSHQILHSELQLQKQRHPHPPSPTLRSRLSLSSLRARVRSRTPSPPNPALPPSNCSPTPSYDPTLITLSALLHDVGDSKYASDQDPSLHAQTVLLSLHAPPALASAVQSITNNISYSHELRNPSAVRAVLQRHPELGIVQDADRLDALGAVGVGRAFTFGGARGRGLEETVEHFGVKLERLEAGMKTVEGRRLARVRTERVRVFRGWWEEECAGLGDGGNREGGYGKGGRGG